MPDNLKGTTLPAKGERHGQPSIRLRLRGRRRRGLRLAGCARAGEQARNWAGDEVSRQRVFSRTCREGAVRHEHERGDLTLIPVGIQSETDIDGQIALVENLITRRVSAIVIAPADSRALLSPVTRAIKAGIKVINIDVAFVGPDNRAGARLSGDVLAKALGQGGKVVIIEGNPGAENGVQRKLGFQDSIVAGKLVLIDSRTAHREPRKPTVCSPTCSPRIRRSRV